LIWFVDVANMILEIRSDFDKRSSKNSMSGTSPIGAKTLLGKRVDPSRA